MKHRLMILVCGLLAMAAKTFADDGLRIEPFEIAANETKEVNIILDDADEVYCGLQFDLYLPEGVEIAYDEEYQEYMCYATSRALERSHTVLLERKEADGRAFYRFLITDMKNRTIGSGEIYTLTLTASDMICTGPQEASFRNVVMSDENQNGPELDKQSFEVTCQVPVAVSSLGYASFSWPRALDFTGTGAQAYIVTDKGDGRVLMDEVKVVPAGTGIIVKAAEGSYYPQTTDATGDDVTRNLLTGTATGSYTVDADNVFVLSNLSDGQAGLYVADSGVTVAQYKSYLKLSSQDGAKNGAFAFDTTAAGIGLLTAPTSSDGVFTLGGQRVERIEGLQKGIYIVNGKKVRMQ